MSLYLSATKAETKIVKNNWNLALEKHTRKEYKKTVCIKPWGYEFLVYESNKLGIWFLKLTKDGATGGLINRIFITSGTACTVDLVITGKAASSANCVSYHYQCCIVNNGGTTALNGAVITMRPPIESAPLVAASVTITANDANDALKVDVNGIGATIINWTCKATVIIA